VGKSPTPQSASASALPELAHPLALDKRADQERESGEADNGDEEQHGVKGPNEKKLSDGHWERAPLEVKQF
jgi:hypothetical protein